MWIPTSVDEIESAAQQGLFKEQAQYEAKQEAGKNKDIAKDVAAMLVDGGVIVYGVAEDENGRPTIPRPIPLAGLKERISNIVRTGVADAPAIQIEEFWTTADPSLGYLAVIIPASPLAPHQVTIEKDMRFYGRIPGGNTLLTQGEINRLYDRRGLAKTDRNHLLTEAIEYTSAPTSNYVYLYAFVRPVLLDDVLLSRAQRNEQADRYFSRLVSSAMNIEGLPQDYSPDFHASLSSRRRSTGWVVHMGSRPEYTNLDSGQVLDLFVADNGSIRLFSGRVGQPKKNFRDEIVVTVSPSAVAGNVIKLLHFSNELYKQAGYFGQLDVGVAITNLQGAIAHMELDPHPYMESEYRRTDRITTLDLNDDVQAIAERLVLPFIHALTQRNYNPYTRTFQ